MIDCQVLKLPKKAFNNLMDANTDFRKDILSIARDREVIRLHQIYTVKADGQFKQTEIMSQKEYQEFEQKISRFEDEIYDKQQSPEYQQDMIRQAAKCKEKHNRWREEMIENKRQQEIANDAKRLSVYEGGAEE